MWGTGLYNGRHAETKEGYPLGGFYRRTAALGLMSRDPGAEANLVGPLELTLSSPPDRFTTLSLPACQE